MIKKEKKGINEMTKLNGKLQYKLSNGMWVDCDDRTGEFLNKCVENDYHHYTIDQVIEILESGKTVRNDKSAHYGLCRTKPVSRPVAPITEWEPDTESYGY